MCHVCVCIFIWTSFTWLYPTKISETDVKNEFCRTVLDSGKMTFVGISGQVPSAFIKLMHVKTAFRECIVIKIKRLILWHFLRLVSSTAVNVHTVKHLIKLSHSKSQNLDVSRLVLQLFLPNPLKPGVKPRTKMWLELPQLHLSDHHFVAY